MIITVVVMSCGAKQNWCHHHSSNKWLALSCQTRSCQMALSATFMAYYTLDFNWKCAHLIGQFASIYCIHRLSCVINGAITVDGRWNVVVEMFTFMLSGKLSLSHSLKQKFFHLFTTLHNNKTTTKLIFNGYTLLYIVCCCWCCLFNSSDLTLCMAVFHWSKFTLYTIVFIRFGVSCLQHSDWPSW